MITNYGFAIRNNKYNSLGIKVFVNYDNDENEPPLLENNAPNQNDCAVCLGPRNRTFAFLCGHLFCEFCSSTILRETPIRRNCPICRAPVVRRIEIFTWTAFYLHTPIWPIFSIFKDCLYLFLCRNSFYLNMSIVCDFVMN